MTVRDVPAFLGKDVREPSVTTGGGLPAWLVIRFGENRQRCRQFSWLEWGFKNSKSQLELMISSNSSRISMSSVMMGFGTIESRLSYGKVLHGESSGGRSTAISRGRART